MPEQEMTVAQLREWLRNWVAETTGLAPDQIAEDKALDEFGLASRDAVALSGELEDLTGVLLDATVAYQHPTIAALAQYIVDGPAPVTESAPDTDTQVLRGGDMETDIAIVGMSARFPGDVATPEQLWELFADGRSAITDLPEGRWEEFLGDPYIAKMLEGVSTKGGYLSQDTVKNFDAEFFSMSPREAEMVDPQQRLLLELTWEALEDAHIPASDLRGRAVSVFIGTSTHDYSLLVTADPATAHPYAITGTSQSIIANRISYTYDFRGASVALDTACSSSLVAVHHAMQTLRLGEASVAVAGGVNMLLAPAATGGFGQLEGVLAPDGRIKAFSADADGISRSEGAGLVILKRLSDAQRDGDQIHAVLKGSAVTSDGHSNGLTAPTVEAQIAALTRAYADAGVDPSQVDYVEAHGTGTVLGDPLEATALGQVLGRGRSKSKPTLLGSAKTNFGHSESAAGILGLLKVVLAMRHDQIPPSLNYSAPNPYIDFTLARLKVTDTAAAWPRYSGKALAGVSGNGFGGTNAHLVVEEYPAASPVAATTPDTAEADGTYLLPVTATMPSRRRRAAQDLADWLESKEGSQAEIGDIARALSLRNHGRSRAVVTATDSDSALHGLRAVAAGNITPGVLSSDTPVSSGPIWVFSGFGAQHRKMAKDLYQSNERFKEYFDEVNALVLDEAGHDLVDMVLDDEQTYDTETAQVGICAIQIALVDLLRYHGAKPAGVLGHSMGEVAAAYAAGGLSKEDAVRVISVRSRLLGEGEDMLAEEEQGAMALVEYSATELDQLIADNPEVFVGVEPAVYAAPTHTTVGGPKAAVEAVVALAEEQGKMGRLLQVRGAGHTHMVDPLLGELAAELMDIEPLPVTVPVFSSVDKDTIHRVGETIHAVDYWTKGMRHSVWFTQAVRLAADHGHTTFMEIAPNPVALMSVAATLFDAGIVENQLIHTLKRKEREHDSFLQALAQLYVYGHDVNLSTIVGDGPLAEIPATAFIRKPYWTKARFHSGVGDALPGVHVALPDGRHAWEIPAAGLPNLDVLVEAAATSVLADVTVTGVTPHGELPAEGRLTTTLTRHPGGASLTIHHSADNQFRLVGEAVVTAGPPLAAYTPPAPTIEDLAEDDGMLSMELDESHKWSPDSGETMLERLRRIVAEAMGYAPEDLPLDVGLIELGLDSLMAVRIKNRVEYEFSIPPLQLQAVRDADLREVARLVEFAVENPDEVTALSQDQAAAKESGGDVDAVTRKAAEKAGIVIEASPAEAGAGAGSEGGQDDGPGFARSATPADAAAPAETAAPSERAGEDTVSSGALAEDLAAQSNALVPPRDTTERLVFASWAVVTGASAGGVYNPLPQLSDDQAQALADRLSERTEGEITVGDIRAAKDVAGLADVVRQFVESEVDGLVRKLRSPEKTHGEGPRTPLFLFNPAGGSTSEYAALVNRLPESVPVYGLERIEGSLAERAKVYVPLVRELQPEGPIVLAGWSFGGALAYEVAHQLTEQGVDIALVALLDAVQPAEPIPDTNEELHARWERYAKFAATTYGFDFEVPHDVLDQAGEDGILEMILELVKTVDLEEMGVSAAIIENQRASFVDNQLLARADLTRWRNVKAPVVLYRAARMHDGAIELEPRYAEVKPDGGWGEIVEDLEIVKLQGDHIAIVDEPDVTTIGKHLAQRLARLEPTKGLSQ